MGRPYAASCFRLRGVRVMTGAALAVLVLGGAAAVGAAPGGAPHPGAVAPADPFATSAMKRYLAGRGGNIAAAVYDVAPGVTYIYHPGVAVQSASIAKVDILAALLAQTQADGGLSAGEQALAVGMIEESDNDDAQDLFEDEGELPALAKLNARLGMTQTTLNWSWGLSYTTPRDQLLLLRYIVFANGVLSSRSRGYELGLMEHVESGENWGVSAGPAGRAVVALKDGWDPVGGTWDVNSIGMVKGDGRFYLIAVLTSEPEEAYGIATIEGISRLVWRELAARAGPSTPARD